MIDEDVHARVLALAHAFRSGELVRLRVEDDDLGVAMTRLAANPAPSATAPPLAPAPAQPVVYDIVTAEIVGIVQFARPAVIEGAVLESDRELAYVEALGIRNPVRSKGPGKIATVFVTEGEPVEYGQPLFAIDRHV